MSDKPATPTPAGDRIAKVIARAGVASRREAEKLIETGQVSV
ncbi:MAG: S4 domain-containing protein, partial [Pseudomonadota bacterium]|nr:S4 domain-containing protein [Pseudomonadota bacterium]